MFHLINSYVGHVVISGVTKLQSWVGLQLHIVRTRVCEINLICTLEVDTQTRIRLSHKPALFSLRQESRLKTLTERSKHLSYKRNIIHSVHFNVIFKVRHMYNLITLIVHFPCPTCFEPLTWVHLQGHII
jgi:hypothetical protein